MIEQWRKVFQVPTAFYAVVQLSTWFANPQLLGQLRDQQLVSGTELENFAYATNADYGAGGSIHPPYKQHCGERLANAAMAIVYKQAVNWRSPTYASGKEGSPSLGLVSVTVTLNDVPTEGLVLKPAANARTAPAATCATENEKMPGSCAWASIQFDDPPHGSWVNATVALTADKKGMTLTAKPPVGARSAIGSSYGWGAVPMMTVYRADMEGQDGQLPVLTWNRTLA